MSTELEDELFYQIEEAKLPTPEREVIFIPGRKFRADFCWKKFKVVAEVNGGTYAHMGHSTGAGIERDYKKLALANLHGWRLFYFTKRMIEDGFAIDVLTKILDTKEE